jgi:hypothetical protein
MDFNFLVGRYDWELKRKDQITTAISFPVTILIFLGGVVVTMAKGFSFDAPTITIGFFVSAIFWAGIAGIALSLFASAYRGSRYEYIPSLHELELFRLEAEDDGQLAAFEIVLRESIIKAVDVNSLSNDRRQALLDRGNIVLLVAAVMAAACGGFYVVEQIVKN